MEKLFNHRTLCTIDCFLTREHITHFTVKSKQNECGNQA